MKPVVLGLLPWEPATRETFASISRQAQRAEALGFHSLWLPEMHFDRAAPWPSPLLAMAAAAATTQRLRLGTASYLLPVRPALQMAEDVAVLDRMSEGRVILGLGRGFQRSLFAAFEVPAREKRARFAANLELMRRAWAGEPVGYEDPERRVPIHLHPRPLQQPHPPLWVAAFGPKAIEQAGRLGLPYLASPAEPLAALERNYALHASYLAEPASDPTVPVMRSVFAARSPDLARRVSEALERQARRLGRAGRNRYARLSRGPVEDWALVGDPERIAERIDDCRRRFGLTHLIARVNVPGVDASEVQRSIELISELPS